MMRSLTLISLLVLLALLAWPYFSVWRLNQAVLSTDPAALSEVVDINRIRLAVEQKLNKDIQSALGNFSDGFVQWLERGFRSEGQGALDRLVTLDWVRGLLLVESMPGEGFLPYVTYAFFDGLTAFQLRIGSEDQQPIQVRLQLIGASWRVSAIYY